MAFSLPPQIAQMVQKWAGVLADNQQPSAVSPHSGALSGAVGPQLPTPSSAAPLPNQILRMGPQDEATQLPVSTDESRDWDAGAWPAPELMRSPAGDPSLSAWNDVITEREMLKQVLKAAMRKGSLGDQGIPAYEMSLYPNAPFEPGEFPPSYNINFEDVKQRGMGNELLAEKAKFDDYWKQRQP